LSEGIIYVAAGQSYVDEAQQSARQVRDVMPDVSITLFTDADNPRPPFDRVFPFPIQESPATAKLIKVSCMVASPYERTLFLDSDVYLCAPIEEVFELLNVFDIAIAHAPNRLYFPDDPYPSSLPAAFPELNTGVIAYRRDEEAVKSLLKSWEDIYVKMHKESGVNRDQISFRKCIYDSNVRFTVLPPEYNYRFPFPAYLDGLVRILHGRHPDLEHVETYVNQSTERRVIEPWMLSPELTTRVRHFVRHCIDLFKHLFHE
jgi:hypothetical protein